MKVMNKSIGRLSALMLFAIMALTNCAYEEPTIDLPAPAPLDKVDLARPTKIFDPLSTGTSLRSTLYNDGSLLLKVEKPRITSEVKIVALEEEELAELVKTYQSFESVGISYRLLPSENISVSIRGDGVRDNAQEQVLIEVKNSFTLDFNDYLYPVVIEVDYVRYYYFIHVPVTPLFMPLTDQTPKPMPTNTFGGPVLENPIGMVAYVETNDWDLRNMANFVLEGSKQPVFDMVVLFAANMNWNSVENRRHLFFNDKLEPIVNNPEVYFRPLQERGIKVLIDILPNHQGVGYENFQSYEEALGFVKELKEWTDKLGIDGWDIDEEYADYYALPQVPRDKVEQSWMWYIKAFKEVMPDKLLTLYDYGHSMTAGSVDEDGKHPYDYIDIGWSDYGRTHLSQVGLPNHRYGNRSIQAGQGGLRYDLAQTIARNTLQSGLGYLMVFNITGDLINRGVAAEDLSGATELFYGQKAIFEGKYYPGPKDRQ